MPVSGEMTVTGNVTLEGTSDVNVANTPLEIDVTNTSDNPVPVNQLKATDWEAVFEQCTGVGETPPIICEFAIPSGKQLTVEMVTANIRTVATFVDLVLEQCKYVDSTCHVKSHVMAMSYLFDGKTWQATHPVRIYAVGDNIKLVINTQSATPVSYYQMSISGHATNIP